MNIINNINSSAKKTKQIKFSQFDFKKEYKLKIFFKDIEIISDNSNYLIFNAISLENYPDIPIEKEELIKVHFAEKSFYIAWGIVTTKQITENSIAEITFERKTQKDFRIKSVKLS